MGWVSRLFGQSSSGQITMDSAPAALAKPEVLRAKEAAPTYAQWVDPPAVPTSTEWSRRLYAYARKCAAQLDQANVPRFRSQWPRGGAGTYVDGFWLVAVDVERADRCWYENVIHREASRSHGHPPPPVEGDLVGRFSGPALLLTASGMLCTAKAEGFFTRNGGLADHEMDTSFRDVGNDLRQLQSLDWGWGNSGRWRRSPKDDLKAYGLQLTSQSIRFTDKWRPGANQNNDGKGTSSAITRFVRSGGSTAWPRNFASFDYD
jgi:hypothetical protein